MLIIDVQNELTNVYTFSGGKVLTKKTFFCGLPLIVKQYAHYDDHHLLFSPEAFYFHTAEMVYATENEFTITDYKKLLHEKMSEMVAVYGIGLESIEVTLSVDMEGCNGSLKDLLGKKGKISWKRHFQALRPDMILQLRESYGQQIDALTYTSRHSALSAYLGTLLHRDSFVCLLLGNEKAELWTIRQGFADCFAYAPLGTHILFEAVQEQGVQKYLYEASDTVPNDFVKKLLFDALVFYWSALIQRIEPYLATQLPIVVCSGSFHPLFYSVAQELFQGKGVFMIPYTPKNMGFDTSATTLDDIAVSAYRRKFSTL